MRPIGPKGLLSHLARAGGGPKPCIFQYFLATPVRPIGPMGSLSTLPATRAAQNFVFFDIFGHPSAAQWPQGVFFSILTPQSGPWAPGAKNMKFYTSGLIRIRSFFGGIFFLKIWPLTPRESVQIVGEWVGGFPLRA